MGKIKKRAGFTLIEVVIAIAIILIIVVSVLLMVTSASANLKESEGKEIAKNIAVYTVEYIRSRNVTYPDNPLGHPQSDFVYLDTTDPINPYYHYDLFFPGLEDLGANPLMSNPRPLKPTNSASDSDTINIHPALPSQNYNTTAFYSSIQGYVSLADNPADSNPSLEDANAEVVGGKYYDKQTGAPYVVKFPLESSDSNAIKNFSVFTGYLPKVYTTDDNKTNPSSPEYDPHYTDTPSERAGAMAYRGFRVLTSIVARVKADLNNPNEPMKDENDDPIQHVQYYDVKVTVFWVTQGKEHSYSLATQVVTYGGG